MCCQMDTTQCCTSIQLQWACWGRKFKFAEDFEILLQKKKKQSSVDTPSSLCSKPLNSIVRESVVLKISLYSPGDALPHGKISDSLLPSSQKCDSPVSNGDISFPNYSGSSWLHSTWGCGEKGGGKEEPACTVKTTHSLPHTGMLLRNFRTTEFGTRWQIPSEEDNKTSTLQGENKTKTNKKTNKKKTPARCSDAIAGQPGGIGRGAWSPDGTDGRKCPVPSCHSPFESEPRSSGRISGRCRVRV